MNRRFLALALAGTLSLSLLYYGQTVARAAEEMGMNLSTAKSRLRRGRERLKEALRKAGYDVEEN